MTSGVNRVRLGKRSTQARWVWQLVGSRKSGETTTSTGNFLVNVLVFAYICHTRGIQGRMVSAGDDAVVKMDDPKLLIEAYASFGLRLELEVVTEFEHLSHCSSRPVKVHGKYMFVRNPYSMLIKLGWSAENRGKPTSKAGREHLLAKVQSHLYEYAEVPYFG